MKYGWEMNWELEVLWCIIEQQWRNGSKSGSDVSLDGVCVCVCVCVWVWVWVGVWVFLPLL